MNSKNGCCFAAVCSSIASEEKREIVGVRLWNASSEQGSRADIWIHLIISKRTHDVSAVSFEKGLANNADDLEKGAYLGFSERPGQIMNQANNSI